MKKVLDLSHRSSLVYVLTIGVRAGGRGVLQPPQLRKKRDFSGKTLMIRATTPEKTH